MRGIACTADEFAAAIQRTRYRLQPVGERARTEHPMVARMAPKSWITSPHAGARVGRGRARVTGVAFGGWEALARVELSVDGGATWAEAALVGPDLGRFAWRPFATWLDFAPGPCTLASRAVDVRGQMQAEVRLENQPGYANTSWVDHAVEVEVL